MHARISQVLLGRASLALAVQRDPTALALVSTHTANRFFYIQKSSVTRQVAITMD